MIPREIIVERARGKNVSGLKQTPCFVIGEETHSVSLTPGSHFGAGFKWGNSIEMEEVFLMTKLSLDIVNGGPSILEFDCNRYYRQSMVHRISTTN